MKLATKPRTTTLQLETMEERIVANAYYSTATIRNESTSEIKYFMQWPGQAATTVAVRPGAYKVHWFNRPNVAPKITFDHSFQSGFQTRSFNLTTRDFIGSNTVAPSRPADGLQYYFKTNTSWTGLNFYADFTVDKSRLSQYRPGVNAIDPRTGTIPFPRLLSNYEVLAAPTRTYNCIAHSLGLHDRWVNPITSGGSNPLAGMDRLYAAQGYQRMNSLDYRLVNGYQKVVVYAKTGWYGNIAEVTHAAIQGRDGSWSSKLGNNALIKHTVPEDVAAGLYGVPVAVYVRRA